MKKPVFFIVYIVFSSCTMVYWRCAHLRVDDESFNAMLFRIIDNSELPVHATGSGNTIFVWRPTRLVVLVPQFDDINVRYINLKLFKCKLNKIKQNKISNIFFGKICLICSIGRLLLIIL